MFEGAAAPSNIRSGGMYAARDRSLPPAVRDEGRRSVGNRKERRLRRDYASFPEGCISQPLSFEVCPKGAREMMFFVPHRGKDAQQTCPERKQAPVYTGACLCSWNQNLSGFTLMPGPIVEESTTERR